MLKVLLADDEKWVRETIKSVLPLETLDLTLAGEASNGLEAFELALQLMPDILLTDIKMPGLNGIDLIAKLKEPLPQLKTIIISGYDEFDFAKKALQLGAIDYLLKPVEEKTVTSVLSRIKQIILKEREELEQEKLLKTHYQMSLPLLRENFLNGLIKKNNYSLAEIKEQINYYDLNLKNSHFEVIVIALDDYITKVKNTIPDNRQVVLEKTVALANRFAKKYLKGLAFFNNKAENELIIIANPEEPHHSGYIQNFLVNVRKIILRRFNITFSAGVSSDKSGYHNLNNLYSEASYALKYKMIFGKSSITFFEEVKNLKITEFNISKDIVQEMVLNMELLNESNLATIIDNLFEQIKRYQETTPDLIKASIWRLIIDLLSHLNCPAFPADKLYEFGDASPYENFKKLETLPDIQEYLKNLLHLMINNHLLNNRLDSENVIEVAKNYLDHHFTKEITLELIANFVHVNPTYFSELFKKETGQNYIEYITGLRMNRAKGLLNQTDLKVYEIAEAVGYTDSKYFCKLFKKTTGMTPKEYKIQKENLPQ